MPRVMGCVVPRSLPLFLALAFGLCLQAPETQAARSNGLAEPVQTNSPSAQPMEAPQERQKETTEKPKLAPGAAPEFHPESETISPSAAMRSSIFKKGLQEWARNLRPNQGGIIWLAIIVTVLVAFDFRKLFSWRNADILLLLAPSFLLVDITRFAVPLTDPTKLSLAGIVFLVLFLMTIVFLRSEERRVGKECRL